ncbi:MAG: sodium:proton exchanger [Ignavibacteriales bacterium CG18_big_fil_WC_8_21_14_2_50_31_20]|nr:MAG: sodium:proton exchanger [Ignavibacteriales bacterium CG18_big_fil_WC_8_21_14_2_50_31_20]
MIVQVLVIIFGFFLLIQGASWMVDGASALARKHNISNLAIGLTIVAFGTSAPELVVNSISSFQGYSDIVFGNIIGSNIFNLFAILGIVGLITPLAVQSSTVWKEIPISFVAILLLFLLCNNLFIQNELILSRLDGLILFIFFALFLYYVYKQLKSDNLNFEVPKNDFSNLKIWTLIIIGLAGLVFGGNLVVTYSVEIATILGISEKIIGLTIVAMGTSLPELVTSVVATLKKNNDIAIGNIIGSNIFNILLILSISSFINPIKYNPLFNFDMYFLGFGTIFLFTAMFMGKKKKLDRWEAMLLLFAYIIYTGFLIEKVL